MKILAVDSSSLAGSCAICDSGSLIGEFFINTRMTHSQTLLPMVQQLLEVTAADLDSIDLFAISSGPGSFTGLRIGISAVKGLAYGLDKPCLPISTLEGLAWNLLGFTGAACAVMDARCNQVYTAMFALGEEGVTRLTPDMAISLDELGEQIKNQNSPVFLVGDGAILCYNSLQSHGNVRLAPPALLHQRASSLCMAAQSHMAAGEAPITAAELAPTYLRLPQAERELKKKQSLSD